MLCRVADSLFWMSRYIERAENTARVADVNIQLLLETANNSNELAAVHWGAILEGLGDKVLFDTLYDEVTSFNVAEFLTFNRDNGSSVLSSIFAARENARMIRDQISSEMWIAINRVYLFLKGEDPARVLTTGSSAFFEQIKEFAHLFRGITDATFPRQLGYEFIRAGCYLERADKTLSILDSKHFFMDADSENVAHDVVQWVSVLRACTGVEAYHRVFVSDVSRMNVVSFLVQSREFPHSVLFSLSQLQLAIHAISRCSLSQFSNEAERITGRIMSKVLYSSVQEIVAGGLHTYLLDLKADIEKIAIELSNKYMFFPIVDSADEAEPALTQTQEQTQSA
jgi:uncharacterized alpha-E superfamily protein